MQIRPYQSEDLNQVIELLRLNTPRYFDRSEEVELIEYLQNDSEHYFVVIENEVLVGSGGINYGFQNGKAARISWDIIHPNSHGKGIGSRLVQFRIEKIKEHANIKTIVVRTSQLVFPFYEKMGFKLESISENFWADGMDMYVMELSL